MGDVVLSGWRLFVMLMVEVVVVEGSIERLSVETEDVMVGQHVGMEGSHIVL